MYSIKLNIDDTILDKVMFFLNNIPKQSIEVKKLNSDKSIHDKKIGDFFMQSPLRDEVILTREKETYTEKIKF